MKNPISLILGLFLLLPQLNAQCPPPLQFKALGVSDNSVVLNWQSGGSHHQIRFGTLNASLPSQVLTSTVPFPLSGLLPTENYWLQVRDSCGFDTLSSWSDTLFIQTRCTTLSAPWMEDFESAAWSNNTTNNNQNHIDSCYFFSSDSMAQYWTIQSQSTIPNSGPNQDHSPSGSKFLYQYRNTNRSNYDSVFWESPLIDLSGISIPELRYWYHFYGNNIEGFKIYISSNFGASYQVIDTLNGPQQSNGNAPWLERRIGLSNYLGQTVLLKFVATNSQAAYSVGLALDDISLGQQNACASPLTGLQLSSFTASSVSFQIPNLNSGMWTIEYGPQGFTPGNGSNVSGSTNTATISNLSPSNSYDFYLRERCAPNIVSGPSPKLQVRTACMPLLAPFHESFDSANFSRPVIGNLRGNMDSCWIANVQNSFFWTTGPPLSNPVNSGALIDNSGNGKYIFSETESYSNLDIATEIYSPLVDLSPLIQPRLRFFYHMFGNDIQVLNIYVHSNGSSLKVDSIVGSQQMSRTAPWQEKIIDLSAYSSSNVSISFESKKASNGFASHVAIDDFYLEETPTCPKPSNLSATVFGNRIQLSWQSNASYWIIEYGPKGFSPGSGTSISAQSNPYTISGLGLNTEYDVYLRDSCGINLLSSQEFIGTFKTDCNPQAAPFLETFDGSTFLEGGNIHQTGSIDPCWKRSHEQSFYWKPRGTGAVSTQTGPGSDHTTGSGKSMQTVISNYVNASRTIDLSSPPIDISSLTTPQLRFFHHLYGNDIESLKVLVRSPDTSIEVLQVIGSQLNSNNAPWTEELIDLSGFAGDTVIITFLGRRKNTFFYRGTLAIDDVELRETPTCASPSNAQVIQATGTALTLNWQGGGANDWQIEYGAPGFTQGQGTLVQVNIKPITIGGLSPNTNYQFYIRDSCGAASLSLWNGPYTFNSGCLIKPTPFLEDFNGSSFAWNFNSAQQGTFDPCWSPETHPNFFWKVNVGQVFASNTGPNSGNGGGTGNKYLYSTKVNFGITPTTTTFTSPWIDLNNLNVPELRYFSHLYGADIDKLVVEVDNGSGWQNIQQIVGSPQTSGGSPWQENTTSLSAYSGDTVQLRFTAHRINTFTATTAIAVDDIEVRETPTCPFPTQIQVDSATLNSIYLSWTTGGANQWQLRYRPSGSNQPYQIIQVNSQPYSLTGLNPSTSYDIEVRDSCGVSDVSIWTGPIVGSTSCGILNVPYLENFDGAQWVPGFGSNNAGGIIDPCWSLPSTSGPHFSPRNLTSNSNNTGPYGDFSGFGNYMYTEASAGYGIGGVIGPQVFIPQNQGIVYLKWAYHMYGFHITDLKVQVRRLNGTFQTLRALTGQQQASSGAAWKVDSVSLQNFQNDTIEFRFLGTSFGYLGDIAIDNVEIKGSQTLCGTPDSLAAAFLSTDSIQLTWHSTNSQIGGKVKVSPLDPPGAAFILNHQQSPLGIGGLQPGTFYRIEVSDSCSATAVSYADTLEIRTLCDSLVASFNFNKLGPDLNALNTSAHADSLAWFIDGAYYGTMDTLNHHFAQTGSHQLKLETWNRCGDRDSVLVLFNVCDSILPGYTYTMGLDSLHFYVNPNHGASQVEWFVNNRSQGTGNTIQYPTDSSGQWLIKLIYANICGDTLITEDTLRHCPPVWATWDDSIVNLQAQGQGMIVYFDAGKSKNGDQFHWTFGDGSTGTGKKISHHYSSYSLNFNVQLIVKNTCGEEDTTSRKLNEIGLIEAGIKSFGVYPNPFSDHLIIETDAQSEVQLSLLDTQGRMVAKEKLDPKDGKIYWDSLRLSKGLYYLKVEHQGEIIIFHLVKP